MSVWPIPADHPVVIRRVADDGRRNPPALTVTLDVLSDFRMIDSYPPGGALRLAATVTRGTRTWRHGTGQRMEDPYPEWMTENTETVIIDQGLNSGVLLSALGHRVAGHVCNDCVKAS